MLRTKKSITNVTFFVHFSSKFWAETAACVKLMTRKIEFSCMSTLQNRRLVLNACKLFKNFNNSIVLMPKKGDKG